MQSTNCLAWGPAAQVQTSRAQAQTPRSWSSVRRPNLQPWCVRVVTDVITRSHGRKGRRGSTTSHDFETGIFGIYTIRLSQHKLGQADNVKAVDGLNNMNECNPYLKTWGFSAIQQHRRGNAARALIGRHTQIAIRQLHSVTIRSQEVCVYSRVFADRPCS